MFFVQNLLLFNEGLCLLLEEALIQKDLEMFHNLSLFNKGPYTGLYKKNDWKYLDYFFQNPLLFCNKSLCLRLGEALIQKAFAVFHKKDNCKLFFLSKAFYSSTTAFVYYWEKR